MHLVKKLRGDIGVFDTSHPESEGRAWLIKQGEPASQKEVSAMVGRLGANQAAKV